MKKRKQIVFTDDLRPFFKVLHITNLLWDKIAKSVIDPIRDRIVWRMNEKT